MSFIFLRNDYYKYLSQNFEHKIYNYAYNSNDVLLKITDKFDVQHVIVRELKSRYMTSICLVSSLCSGKTVKYTGVIIIYAGLVFCMTKYDN